jgi:ketopantoate hydroxymethyltransferase
MHKLVIFLVALCGILGYLYLNERHSLSSIQQSAAERRQRDSVALILYADSLRKAQKVTDSASATVHQTITVYDTLRKIYSRVDTVIDSVRRVLVLVDTTFIQAADSLKKACLLLDAACQRERLAATAYRKQTDSLLKSYRIELAAKPNYTIRYAAAFSLGVASGYGVCSLIEK